MHSLKNVWCKSSRIGFFQEGIHWKINKEFKENKFKEYLLDSNILIPGSDIDFLWVLTNILDLVAIICNKWSPCEHNCSTSKQLMWLQNIDFNKNN